MKLVSPVLRPLLALLAIAMVSLGAAAPGAGSLQVSSGDRLGLEIGLDGSVSRLQVDSRSIPLLSSGGFFLQDMSRSAVPQDIPVQGRAYPGVALRGGKIEPAPGGGVRQLLSLPQVSVSFEATYTPHEGYLEIESRLKNLSPDDRALTLYFRLPFDATGWTWGHALGDEQEVKEADRRYEPQWFYRGSRPSVSRSHIASLSGKECGLSLALRADDPRLFRITYEKRFGFSIEFELGLTPRTLKFPNEATARFLLFRHDPRWGLRSALDRYLRFFPEWYARNPKAPDGLWVTAIPKDLADPEDFGITYFETYEWSRATSRQHGILHMKYTEPWCDHIHGGWEDLKAGADPSSKPAGRALAKGQPDYVACRAALASAVLDRSGKPQAFWSKERGGDAGFSDGEGYGPDLNRYITNPSRDIPVPATATGAGDSTKLPAEEWLAGTAGASVEPMSRLVRKDSSVPWPNRGQSVYGWELHRQWGREPDPRKADNLYEGLYYDSTGGAWTGWHLYNFNPDHLAVAVLPAVFDHQTRRVALYHGFSCLEFMRECSKKMSEEGRVTMANSGPGFDLFYVAPHLSMMGAGENYSGEGDLDPLRQLRLAAGPKPLSFLYTPNLDEQIFEKCLLYAIFPGGFKVEKRALFKKYVPALRALGRAGWQPIPYAQAEPPGRAVERFGWGESLHFAVYSPQKGGPAAGPVTLRIEAEATGLGRPDGTALRARDLVTGETLPLVRDGAAWKLSFELDPGRTRAFAVSP